MNTRIPSEMNTITSCMPLESSLWYTSGYGMLPVMVCFRLWYASGYGMLPVMVCFRLWYASGMCQTDLFLEKLFGNQTGRSIPALCGKPACH
jgi:hypothetical protein